MTNDLPEREQQRLVHDILDVLAGKQSAKALEQNPQNTAGGNFYAVRNAMEKNAGMVNAVKAYLSNPSVDAKQIRQDLYGTSEKLMNNMTASLEIETGGKVKMDDFVRTQQQMAADSEWNKMPAKQNKMGR